MQVDLNADVGEGQGTDADLMPFITSANVACGAHAGDAATMARTVVLARTHGVAVGAHPGYPDRDGFGRRDLDMTAEELEASLLAQLSALGGVARALEVDLVHVKPHGALYNRAAIDPPLATIVARATRRFSAHLVLVGLAGSALLEAGLEAGLTVAAEAFADRAYEPDGTLRSRRHPDAVHHEPLAVAAQAVSIARDRCVRAHDGSGVAVRADTICLHGDTPGAAAIARAVRQALSDAGITVRALARPRSPAGR